MDSKLSRIMSMASAYPATSCSSRLANDLAFTPESSFSTSRSLSFAPSIRVEEPTLSIVAIRLRLESFSGASDSITFQRPLNSSISAMSFRISGVIVMFLISWGRISIYTHFHPIPTQRARNIHLHPFTPIRKVDEITPEHLAGFVAGLQAKEWEVASVNSALRGVRRVFRLGIKWGIITAMPEVSLLRGENHRDRVITPQEEAKYLASADEPLVSIASLLVDTGLRPEECF